MDLVIYPLSTISIIAIIIMIGTLIFFYIKKIMMTYALIITNLIVFFLTVIFPNQLIGELGFRPVYLTVQYSPQIYKKNLMFQKVLG